MKEYKRIVQTVLNDGVRKKNRTGIDTLSVSGMMFRHNMRKGFPLLTTKKMPIKTIATELEFFIRGYTDKRWLQDRGCMIWNEWGNPNYPLATFEGPWAEVVTGRIRDLKDDAKKQTQASISDLGPIYGSQWRNWNAPYIDGNSVNDDNSGYQGVDQLRLVIDTLRTNPTSRRMIVSAWNPEQLHRMALPPCHYAFQLISDGEYVDLLWNQRSVDVALGLPFNIASYGLLLKLIANEVGMVARNLIGFLADTHIYVNHIKGLREQMERVEFELPTIGKIGSLWAFDASEVVMHGYNYHSRIKFEVAV